MGEPQRFYSSPTLDLVPEGNAPQDDKLSQKPSGETLLTSQIETDLKCWMTFSPETRYARCKWFADLIKFSRDKVLDRKQNITVESRKEILLKIIGIEANHPLGDSQVAAIAFRGLFPSHIPRGAKAVAADAST